MVRQGEYTVQVETLYYSFVFVVNREGTWFIILALLMLMLILLQQVSFYSFQYTHIKMTNLVSGF